MTVRGFPVSRRRAQDVLRSTFWLVPALCVVASIGLAVALIALDTQLGTTHTTIFLFPGPPGGARTFLSAIVQAMISFTGLVFSITIVVLQLSSGQFSPRVLRTFLRDRTIQFSLGLFMATFVYAMVVLRAVQGGGGSSQTTFVPQLAVTAAFAFVLGSVALFIHYIAHVANLIRVATIIELIRAEFAMILDRRCPADQPAPSSSMSLARATGTVPATRTGVVVSVDEAAVVRAATQAQCMVALVPRVGDFVPAGAPLFTVHANPGSTVEVAHLVSQDTERSTEQDLACGFRQLVDIAERALSTGINDPTTATQAIDALHDMLRRLATRHLPTGRHCGPDGTLRLLVPQYEFGDYLELAVGEIWRYGSDAAQVPSRLRSMVADLAVAALPEHRPALRSWMEELEVASSDGDSGPGPRPAPRISSPSPAAWGR